MSDLRQHFDDVGPGWRHVLKALDECFDHVVERYPEADCKIHILQVKEKFGGLRCYVRGENLTDEQFRQTQNYIGFAEIMCEKICEQCGKPATARRTQLGARFGWVKALCEEHHAERDAGVRGQGRRNSGLPQPELPVQDPAPGD